MIYLVSICLFLYLSIESWPDPPEKCNLTVKKLPKNLAFFQKLPKIVIMSKKWPLQFFGKKWKFLAIFFEKMSSFWQFFDSQMAIFRRVRYRCVYRDVWWWVARETFSHHIPGVSATAHPNIAADPSPMRSSSP